MHKKLCDIAFGREIELRERLFRVILLIGGLMTFGAIIESILLKNVELIFLPLFGLMFVMGISLYVTFRYHKMDVAAALVGIIIMTGVFPWMFFLNGGIDGGAAVWFVLSLIYVFVMFSGKWLVFFLAFTIVVDVSTYVLGYLHPEMIVPMRSREAVYLDSFFGVMAVGIAVGVFLKFQVKIFQIERSVTLAQKEELEKVSNSRNEFFANMSHEIRTPINTIVGLNEMILRENPVGETAEYAREIQAASRMLLTLVNDILDLSCMEVKRMEIVPEAYETAPLFEELVDMVQVSMQQKKLEFLVDIDENLPAALYGDEKRIKQVLLNILSNAVKYTREGSVTFSVQGEETKEGTIKLKMTVADTGIGIRKEDFGLLYDAFQRVDKKRTNHVEGSGLGLAITKQLLDLMGGEITVDSIYTKGTTFTVILEQPVVDTEPIGKIRFADKNRNYDGNYYRQSFEAPEARVLIADDNEMNAMVVQRLLLSTKMQIDVAGGGEECLAKTKQKYYNVILMDYTMPKMSGIETLERIRRQENGLCRESAVLIVTANIMTDARKLCAENGFDGYLEKPIQPMRLEAEILKFLPEEIVEYRKDSGEETERINQIQQIAQRRRKKIYVTSDCVCDLPEELLEKYDIRLMYLYIETRDGRFADTREIDADSLSMYLTQDSSYAHSSSVSVEEYEDFFAETLTLAEQVIHISMAAFAGKSYGVAVAAGRGFDHVQVIDSGLVSGGEGLLVLYAARLAQEGCSMEEICAGIERIKGRIESCYMMPSGRIFHKNGYMDRITAKMCNIFHLHPVLAMRQSHVLIVGTRGGRMESAWKRFLHWHLRHRRKIETDVIIITHVGCTIKQQEMIRAEVLKCVPFERVIMQKASFSNSCNTGIGTIGIAFYTRQ